MKISGRNSIFLKFSFGWKDQITYIKEKSTAIFEREISVHAARKGARKNCKNEIKWGNCTKAVVAYVRRKIGCQNVFSFLHFIFFCATLSLVG